MSPTNSTSPPRVRLPPPPVRPRPVAPPTTAVAAAAIGSGALGLTLGVAPQGVGATSIVTALAVVAGWAVDRVLGSTLGARRERVRFLRALDEVDDVVDRARAVRTRDLAEWYPTADRVGAGDVVGRAPRALVLGLGRASSGLVLEGRPEDGLEADDPARARLARLRAEAATLDEAPLCVPLGSTVRVVGPPVVAEAVASGLRRQLRSAGASRAEAAAAVDVRLAWTAGPPVGAAEAGPSPVDTVVTVGPDGEATVTLKDGRPCRQPLRVAFVSVLDE